MKTFTVEFEDGPGTRWLEDDARIAAHLQTLAAVVGSVNTGGTKPRVTVTLQNGQRAEGFGAALHETTPPTPQFVSH